MHAALILDDERLALERPMLNRLCVGLMGEGVQVTRIVSDTQSADASEGSERRMALASRIEAPFRVLPWMRHSRVTRLIDLMEKSPPDIVYAIGAGAWALGVELAKALNAPALLDVWAQRLVDQIPRGSRAGHVGGYVAPTQAIAQSLSQRVGPELVSLVPIGVSVREANQQNQADPASEPAVAVLGDSRDVPAYRAMLAGLSRTVRDYPRLEVVLELRGAHEHDVWREAGRLSLLPNISAISDLSRYRRLLNGCQVVLMPERFGELRSVMLEAMGSGSAFVVSGETPLDMFINGDTALLINTTEPDSWATALARVLANADERQRLGAAASRLVRTKYRSTNHVEGLIATFEKALAGDSVPFITAHAKQL